MAIERRVEDTGIEKRLTYTAATDADKRALIAHAQRLIDRERRNWRRDAERLARSVLESSTAIPAAKRDADELLYVLVCMDKARAAGDADTALWLAYKVGTWVDSLHTRKQEHHALRGRKTIAAAGKGGAGKHKAAREKWPTYQPAVSDIMKRTGLSYTAACGIVANKNKVDIRTIKRHTKNPKNS